MMRTITRLTWTTVILAVAGCANSHPQTDITPRQPSLADIQRQYAEAEARVNDMEARVYAANPRLQPAEDQYDRLNNQYQLAMATIDSQVETLLDEQKKQHGDDSVRDAYDIVESQWQMVRKAEQAADPEKAELLRAGDLADPDFITNMSVRLKSERPELKDVDLSNPDKFWQAYRESWASNLQRLTDAATKTGQSLGLPEIALTWARRKAAMEMDLDLYGAYLDVATPPDLQAARDALDDLQDEMDSMTPPAPMPSTKSPATLPATVPATTQPIAP